MTPLSVFFGIVVAFAICGIPVGVFLFRLGPITDPTGRSHRSRMRDLAETLTLGVSATTILGLFVGVFLIGVLSIVGAF